MKISLHEKNIFLKQSYSFCEHPFHLGKKKSIVAMYLGYIVCENTGLNLFAGQVFFFPSFSLMLKISFVQRRILSIPDSYYSLNLIHSFHALSCEMYIENWVVCYFCILSMYAISFRQLLVL